MEFHRVNWPTHCGVVMLVDRFAFGPTLAGRNERKRKNRRASGGCWVPPGEVVMVCARCGRKGWLDKFTPLDPAVERLLAA